LVYSQHNYIQLTQN